VCDCNENSTAYVSKGHSEATLKAADVDDDDNDDDEDDDATSLPFSDATNDVSSEWHDCRLGLVSDDLTSQS